MAQKTKVKELVGRGLHSYHTKALQQMDRIEKKNKEQNHKISILSNELDNDYLTKTEEGSVISLEHSKEGMVYLDELQGNTLVNYCADGSKEMTLNGDIDVEGTNVTLTEGVDNGLVDVVCEGNTLVNLIKNSTWLDNNHSYIWTEDIIYNPVGKTVTLFNLSDKKIEFAMNTGANLGAQGNYYSSVYVEPFSKDVINIPSGNGIRRIVGKYEYGWSSSDVDKVKDKVVLLDGNYSNIDISYFEGMKSVGQDDENGHKIEILSKKEIKIETERGNINPNTGVNETHDTRMRAKDYIEVKPSTEYRLTRTIIGGNIGTRYYDANKQFIVGFTYSSTDAHVFTTPSNCKYLKFIDESGNLNSVHKLVLTKDGDDKKEILLNEPLRGLPNGVKDRFVKIDGKWFIERNISKIVLNGTYSEKVRLKQFQTYNDGSERKTVRGTIEIRDFKNLSWEHSHDCLSYTMNNKYLSYRNMVEANEKDEEFCNTWNFRCIVIQINKSKLSSVDETGFNSYLQNNPVEVIYQLETPIYEPLEVESTLNTYNDITHISNNSIIPCNMKIKNSGYNAIIKPSTLYTIALDTNKSGTIGMNLGGVKGTTTNNVLTLTTPATLTDDSLRLYGKGIKGSKIRLLEGDKTNWIPSHFEGMKSSFEDKLQEDGTYKMEILSSNKNMFNKIDAMKPSNWLIGTYHSFKMQLKPNTRYCVSVNYRTDKPRWIGIFEKPYNYDGVLWAQIWNNGVSDFYKVKFTTPKDGVCYLSVYSEPNTVEDRKQLFNEVYNDLTIQEEIFGDEPIIQNSNKIQFSSIEPLRKWDRFVFKDGQLMIERGSKIFVLDGNKTGISYTRGFGGEKDTDTNMLFSMRASKEVLPIAGADGGCSSGMCNILPNIYTIDIATKSVPIGFSLRPYHSQNNYYINIRMDKNRMISNDTNGIKDWLNKNNLIIEFPIIEPTYEEIPYELQKIILEGYENGTLFFDTNIPPTSTVTYAGETPIVKSVKLNKTEVLNNTNDINDNIIPYLMDMDYRVVCLQLATEEIEGGVSMARLFGGAYEMLKRDILSKRLTREEYGYRLTDYYNAGKLTEEQVRELEDLR